MDGETKTLSVHQRLHLYLMKKQKPFQKFSLPKNEHTYVPGVSDRIRDSWNHFRTRAKEVEDKGGRIVVGFQQLGADNES